MSNTNLPNGINAWILLSEDEPKESNYNSPDSCFQSLIKYKVYERTNFLGIAFFNVVPSPNGGSTIEIGSKAHPDGLSNQDYLNFVIRDARNANPNIKLLATMGYGATQSLASIFTPNGDPQQEASDFANNLVNYLSSNGMNGIDIDWEPDLSNDMTKTQFKILFSTIRSVFDSQKVKFYLTFAPAWPTASTDYDTVNSSFDFISPQLYDGRSLSSFLDAGMSPDLMGYGAQFEPGNSKPNRSAQQVHSQVTAGFSHQGTDYNFQEIFMWRLNSGNFQFEQGQFLILHELFNPSSGNSFDDSSIIGAAGYPAITEMTIRSGDVLNAIQTVNIGTGEYNTGTDPNNLGVGIYTLLQHGGNGGDSQTIQVSAEDPIVEISGYKGVWYGWNCILQLTLTTKSGKTYGPFGNMNGATSKTEFSQSQAGKSVVAFSGSTITVPMADGSYSAIISNLNAIFA